MSDLLQTLDASALLANTKRSLPVFREAVESIQAFVVGSALHLFSCLISIRAQASGNVQEGPRGR